MKLTAKDLMKAEGSDEYSSSPCCEIKGSEHEKKFYVTVPVTEAAIKGLVIGKKVTLVVEGVLSEVRSRWSPELSIEVSSIDIKQGNEFEELLDDEE
jgi:hypothetical protein